MVRNWPDQNKKTGENKMFKITSDTEKRGEIINGKIGVVEMHNIHITNEKGQMLFTWTVKGSTAERDAEIAKFNAINSDAKAVRDFVSEIKAKRGW
jgi:hypothetical protein